MNHSHVDIDSVEWPFILNLSNLSQLHFFIITKKCSVHEFRGAIYSVYVPRLHLGQMIWQSEEKVYGATHFGHSPLIEYNKAIIKGSSTSLQFILCGQWMCTMSIHHIVIYSSVAIAEHITRIVIPFPRPCYLDVYLIQIISCSYEFRLDNNQIWRGWLLNVMM